MPVDLPDSSVHKICMRCRRWFEPNDGTMVLPEATGPISGLRRAAATIADDESALRFICWQCLRRRRRSKAIIWIAFAIVVGIALLAAWLRGQL
jgi:hypothetical protein